MANSQAFEEAVGLVAAVPRLSVGCHVMLVDGAPLLPSSQVASLTVQQTHGAAFRDGFGALAGCAVRGRLSGEDIEAEATAQIKKIQSAGVAVSHLDTHKH